MSATEPVDSTWFRGFELPDRWVPLRRDVLACAVVPEATRLECDALLWWPALRWSWPFIEGVDTDRRDLDHFCELGASVSMAFGRFDEWTPAASATQRVVTATGFDADVARGIVCCDLVTEAVLGASLWGIAADLPSDVDQAVAAVRHAVFPDGIACTPEVLTKSLDRGTLIALDALAARFLPEQSGRTPAEVAESLDLG